MSDRKQLPESSRAALLKIADRLREGFSGQIVLECHQGGVRQVAETRSWQPGKK